MFLTESDTPLALVAIFKASSAGRLVKANDDEIRRRCRHCGWVNVFHPEQNAKRAGRLLDFKKLTGHVA